MAQPHLQIESAPSFADIRCLEDRLYEYNVARTGVDNGQWLAIFMRDGAQNIFAGLEGWTWCGSCYIRLVWVHEDLRGQGVGSALLQAAEQGARARGCQLMVLESFSFQAPGFYETLGYETWAILEDHPHHHRHHYLRKRLV